MIQSKIAALLLVVGALAPGNDSEAGATHIATNSSSLGGSLNGYGRPKSSRDVPIQGAKSEDLTAGDIVTDAVQKARAIGILKALRTVDVNSLRLTPMERRVLRGCSMRLALALADLGMRGPVTAVQADARVL